MQVEEVLHHFRSPNKKKHCLQSIEAFLRESITYVVYYGFARYVSIIQEVKKFIIVFNSKR